MSGDTIRFWGTELALIVRTADGREFHFSGEDRDEIEGRLRCADDPQAVLRRVVADELDGEDEDDAAELAEEQARRLASVREITGGVPAPRGWEAAGG